MAVDVEDDRFDLFVIFLCWDVHSKDRVEVISFHHTVLILFAQCNGVEENSVPIPMFLDVGNRFQTLINYVYL